MNSPQRHPAQDLLDFIARFESRGNYNIIFGGSIVPELTTMNLTNVQKLMTRMLADQRRRQGRSISTAVGKYQIIRKTLRSLITNMRLDPNAAIFDPPMQDRMALELLRGRGYDRFVAGTLSAEQFAINVAKEWAAMPLANGRSFYAQDGVNRALVSYEEFMRAIHSSRPSAR